MSARVSRLIIAPHCDDEVLWTFSVLTPHSKVFIFSDYIKKSSVSKAVSEELGYALNIYDFPATRLYEHFLDIKDIIETEMKAVRYDEVYIPCRTHHQDHNTVNDVMQIVSRPTNFHSITSIFEYPYWDMNHFHYTTVRKVSPRKFRYVERFAQGQWTRFIKTYNKFVALKYEYPGYYEPFRLIFQRIGG